MNPRNRGVVMALGGLFSGFFGARILGEQLELNTWAKAGIACVITVAVSLLLLRLLPTSSSSAEDQSN